MKTEEMAILFAVALLTRDDLHVYDVNSMAIELAKDMQQLLDEEFGDVTNAD